MSRESQDGKEAVAAQHAPRKVFFFGIDGASWNVLEPLFDRGELPTLRSFLDEGCFGKLNNLGCPKSPAIWTSMATGVPPEQHGVDDFTTWAWKNPISGRLVHTKAANRFSFRGQGRLLPLLGFKRVSVSSAQRARPAVWNILSNQGRSTGVVNWWATYPAEQINGFIVSDHANFERIRLRNNLGNVDIGAEEARRLSGLTYPEELQRELSQAITMSDETLREKCLRFAQLDAEMLERFDRAETFTRGDPVSILKFSVLQDHFSVAATRHILQEHGQPDFLTTYLGGLDAVSHYFWKFLFPEGFSDIDPEEMAVWERALPEYYAYYDEVLSDLMESLDDDTIVMVVSDHGFHAVRPEGSEGANSGTHTEAPDGVFFARGPDVVAASRDVGRPSVLDLLPTWLCAMQLPVPTNLPGTVVSEMFAVEPAIEYINGDDFSGPSGGGPGGNDSSAEDVVEDRLRALGYID